MSEGSKINLFIRNKTAYIWTAEDWKLMRNNRVLGNFVGNLASLPRQDFHEGLPLALLPEEATLLIEKGLALPIEVHSLSGKPSHEVRQQNQSYRDKILTEQVQLLKNSRKREIEENIKLIVKGKKLKNNVVTNSAEEEQLLEKTYLEEELNKIQDPKPSSLSVQMFIGDPWINEEDCKKCHWCYPETMQQALRYLTFKDLWEQGYYVTSGNKFGVDFLVYPGDPVKFHSFFIVKCIDKKQELTPKEIIAYGRLGQAVRKTYVLAYFKDKNKVDYQSIRWAGR